MKERYISIPPDKWQNFIDIAFDNSKYYSLTLFSECLSSKTPEYEYMVNELDSWVIDKSEDVGIWFENVSHERTSFIILPECRITEKLKENGMIIF